MAPNDVISYMDNIVNLANQYFCNILELSLFMCGNKKKKIIKKIRENKIHEKILDLVQLCMWWTNSDLVLPMVWNPGGRGLIVCQRWASLKYTRIWRPTASCCRKSSCAGGRRASPGRNRGKIPFLFSLIRAHYAHGTLQDCRWLNDNPSYLALFRKDSSHSRTQLISFCLLKTQYSTSCGVELLHLTVVGIRLSAPAPGSRPAIATIRRGNQLQHAQGGMCKGPKSGLEIQSRASECFLKPSGDFLLLRSREICKLGWSSCSRGEESS